MLSKVSGDLTTSPCRYIFSSRRRHILTMYIHTSIYDVGLRKSAKCNFAGVAYLSVQSDLQGLCCRLAVTVTACDLITNSAAHKASDLARIRRANTVSLLGEPTPGVFSEINAFTERLPSRSLSHQSQSINY